MTYSFTFECSFSCMMCNCDSVLGIYWFIHSLYIYSFNQHLSSTYKDPGLVTLKSSYQAMLWVPSEEDEFHSLSAVSRCLSGTSCQWKQNQSLREAVHFLKSHGQQSSYFSQTSSSLNLEGINWGRTENYRSVRLRGWIDGADSVDHKISQGKPRTENSCAGSWDLVMCRCLALRLAVQD